MHVSKKAMGRIAVTVALLLASVGVSRAFFRFNDQRLPERFATVEPGVLYRSNQPDAQELANVKDRYGIHTLVIAREEPSEELPNEADVARKMGLNVVSLPIRFRERVNDENIRAFFKCVDDPSNRPILVHCSGGRHRTGFLCALYEIERQGSTTDQAIERMVSFGFDEMDQSVLLTQLRSYKPGTHPRAAPSPK